MKESSDTRITFVRACVCGNSAEIRSFIGKPYRVMCGKCGKWLVGTIGRKKEDVASEKSKQVKR